mmetsp:Transcript_11230/g.15428  ORF Transcript_11230/g.15428 Transcript_11230/m.15428 type:complete len:279 (+) Transcript_11230:58-894(+)
MSRIVALFILFKVCSGLAPLTSRATFDPIGVCTKENVEAMGSSAPGVPRFVAASTAAAISTLAVPDLAVAKGGEYGLCEGRIISFLHPIAMGFSFFATGYAGYTGFQWRRLREMTGELSQAKKVAKEKTEAYESALAAAGEGGSVPSATLTAKNEAQAMVDSLSVEVSSLREGNFRDVHFSVGSVLLAIGVPFAIEGPVNTYMRAGKLFPGPHLYAGAAVVSLWALAASLVPQMQKGKDWARQAHVAINAVTFGLFAYYQVPTGLEIAQKVIEKTKFP